MLKNVCNDLVWAQLGLDLTKKSEQEKAPVRTTNFVSGENFGLVFLLKKLAGEEVKENMISVKKQGRFFQQKNKANFFSKKTRLIFQQKNKANFFSKKIRLIFQQKNKANFFSKKTRLIFHSKKRRLIFSAKKQG